MSFTNLRSTPLITTSTVAVSGSSTFSNIRIRGFMAATGVAGGTFTVTEVSAAGTNILTIPMVSSATSFLTYESAGFRPDSNVVFVSVPVSGTITLIYDGG